MLNLDTQASTIAGDLFVTATRAAITANSFGVAASGNITLNTLTAGTDIFALGAIAAGTGSMLSLNSAGRISGSGRMNAGSISLNAVSGVGSAATPINYNSTNLNVKTTSSGGAFFNSGASTAIVGDTKGDFQLKTTGDITLGTLSATGAFLLQADGQIQTATAGITNLSGGAGANSITSGAIIGTRANPVRVSVAGSLFADAINAGADGNSIVMAGSTGEGTLRLAAPPGAVVFNDIPIFVPQINFFTAGQLTFNGQQLFPDDFDLTQASIAAAALRNQWQSDTGDQSMGMAGQSGRALMEDNMASDSDEQRDQAEQADAAAGPGAGARPAPGAGAATGPTAGGASE